MPAKHVPRKLVKEDDGRDGHQRVGQECLNRKLALFTPELQEILPDPVIQFRFAVPPLIGFQPKPELQDVATPVLAQAAVPPTVRPSTSKVGWPTPAGTLWPPLPQMPTPSSSARSLPMPLTRVSTVGPSPISVAPLIGSAITPPRMR